jgi:hypothetical protein
MQFLKLDICFPADLGQARRREADKRERERERERQGVRKEYEHTKNKQLKRLLKTERAANNSKETNRKKKTSAEALRLSFLFFFLAASMCA